MKVKKKTLLVASGFVFVLVLFVAFALAKPDPVMNHFGMCIQPQELSGVGGAEPDCDGVLGKPTGTCTPGELKCKQGNGLACVWRCGGKGTWGDGSYCTSKMCNDKMDGCDAGPSSCWE